MTAAATIGRQLLTQYLVEGWLGSDLLDRTLCPWVGPGDRKFDLEDETWADTAPFSPLEARDLGYVEWSQREVDSFQNGTTSGWQGSPTEIFVSAEYSVLRVRFSIRTPGDADPELAETYEEAIKVLVSGLTIVHDGPPIVRLRQPVDHVPRRWGDLKNGSWDELLLDYRIEREERRAHAGVQEVILS